MDAEQPGQDSHERTLLRGNLHPREVAHLRLGLADQPALHLVGRRPVRGEVLVNLRRETEGLRLISHARNLPRPVPSCALEPHAGAAAGTSTLPMSAAN